MKRIAWSVAAAALAVALSGAPALAQDAQQVYETRNKAMKSVSGSMKKIAAFVKNNEGSAADVAIAAAVINQVAKDTPGLFPKGPQAEKSRAKAEIWSDWDKFVAAAKDMENRSALLLASAQANDARAIRNAFGPLGKTCGGCHKPFRGPKKD